MRLERIKKQKNSKVIKVTLGNNTPAIAGVYCFDTVVEFGEQLENRNKKGIPFNHNISPHSRH